MFQIYKRRIGDVEPFEHLAGAESLALGSAAKYTAGSLAKCGPTDKPTHIVVGVKTVAGAYPAIPVLPTTIFETTASVAVPAATVGSAVTLGADAASVTATTTSGVFTVDETDGLASGVVRGHFA